MIDLKVIDAMSGAIRVLARAGIEVGIGEMHNSGQGDYVFLALMNVRKVGVEDYEIEETQSPTRGPLSANKEGSSE